MLRRRNSELAPSAPPIDSTRGKLYSSLSLDSQTIPSAPPLEPLLSFQTPVSQLELTISASNLLNLDQLTKSDPLCVLFLLDSTTANEWIEMGRTEVIRNNLNPEFKTKFLIDYRFEEKQMLTLMLFDKDCAKFSLENHDFLGTCECTVGEIVAAPHSKLVRPLKLPSIHNFANKESKISIIADEIGDSKQFIKFKIKYVKCGGKQRSSFILKGEDRKMFLNISNQLIDGCWALLHRTERVMSGEVGEIAFQEVKLRYSSVCRKGNLETPLRFQMFQVKHTLRGKSPKMIGEKVTNLIELSEKFQSSDSFEVQLEPPGSKFSNSSMDFDKILISEYKVEPQKTFIDYIQEGLEIKFAVALDFTASNGEPTSHASLHYKHGKRDNPYVMTLKIVGEILQDYSQSKQFYAYGFGAKGFPVSNRVNHKFALNFKETNPLCEGIKGVLTAYYRALQRVKLYGPTCFAPVIREVREIARGSNQEYFVLLILTDGIVCDPETTMDALVSAADTPMSVIIIGIGDEDFTIMEKFDSDEKLLKSRSKRRASRDIVQFVELRKYVNFKSITPITEGSKKALARSVLAELPEQVVSWMHLRES